MKQSNQFLDDILDLDHPQAADDRVWIAGRPTAVTARDGVIEMMVPFQIQQRGYKVQPDTTVPPRLVSIRIRAYGDAVVRCTARFGEPTTADDTPMLEWDSRLKPVALKVRKIDDGWAIIDPRNRVRMKISTRDAQLNQWIPPEPRMSPPPPFDVTIFPDGKTPVAFNTTDRFFPQCVESCAMAFVARNDQPHRAVFSLANNPDEHYAGTGERFAGMDLAGRTIPLENTDGLGVNNRRCYKNIPFYLSSRPYGLFLHTHAHARLSLADVSTRAAQGLVEEPALDLFFIGGGTPERILFNYRRITGFPPELPPWSYGIWMSRMSYRSAGEVGDIARKLRAGDFPCDVLHLDVGWFDEEWNCDWKFGTKTFPEPEKFMREMRDLGFRITLWQLPHVGKTTKLFPDAVAKKFAFSSESGGKISDSIFSGLEYVATIDFTNPDAVAWYQGLLAKLLRQGAAAIKCDFGEHIHMDIDYHTMPGRRLHNLFALLYQKAAFEITRKVHGEKKAVIWARSGWAGSQRYPLHWGGDAAGSWDGMAGSLRGGLHFGVSGFAFWSHDIPGFHGVPHFINTWPADDLYIRWTQFGVFTSHMRYHGAQPREPYEYPAIADLIRQWWRLRYALIPYFLDEARAACRSGFPILRAMLLHHPDDPQCWHIDNQFFCGSKLLIAPVMNSEGIRDVYLPAGEWIDFWTGKVIRGPVWLKNVKSPLGRLPVYAMKNSHIKIYPEPVHSTDTMNMRRCTVIKFDKSYKGFGKSAFGKFIDL